MTSLGNIRNVNSSICFRNPTIHGDSRRRLVRLGNTENIGQYQNNKPLPASRRTPQRLLIQRKGQRGRKSVTITMADTCRTGRHRHNRKAGSEAKRTLSCINKGLKAKRDGHRAGCAAPRRQAIFPGEVWLKQCLRHLPILRGTGAHRLTSELNVAAGLYPVSGNASRSVNGSMARPYSEWI